MTSRLSILLAVALGAASLGTVTTVATASAPSASAFVPITPCRLLDTRPGDTNVGARAATIGPGETITLDTWGTNGNCTIPAGATALTMNIVSIEPTASSFLTVWPADADRPTASSLNWVAGQAPTPNNVTAAVSATGRLSLFNLAGSVHVAIDVVGWYAQPTAGPTGPQGPTGAVGPTGPSGEAGVSPADEVWVAPSGAPFTSLSAALASITDASASNPYVIRMAPGVYTEASMVILKDHVDIVGSGPGTVIEVSSQPGFNGSDVDVELRSLSISSRYPYALSVVNLTTRKPVVLRDVAVSAVSNAGMQSAAVAIYGADVTLDRVSATLQATGTFPTALFLYSTRITATDLDVTIRPVAPASLCIGLRVVDSTGSISGGRVDASCSSSTTGVLVEVATVTLSDVDIELRDSSSGIGMNVGSDAVVTADGVHADVGGPAVSRAVTIDLNGRLTMVDSELRGSTSSVTVSANGVLRLVDSVLDGPTTGAAGDCVGALTPALTPFTCS